VREAEKALDIPPSEVILPPQRREVERLKARTERDQEVIRLMALILGVPKPGSDDSTLDRAARGIEVALIAHNLAHAYPFVVAADGQAFRRTDPVFSDVESVEAWCAHARATGDALLSYDRAFGNTIEEVLKGASWPQADVERFLQDPDWIKRFLTEFLHVPEADSVALQNRLTPGNRTDIAQLLSRALPSFQPSNVWKASVYRVETVMKHVEKVESVLRERDRFLTRRHDGRIAWWAACATFVAFVFGVILPLLTPNGASVDIRGVPLQVGVLFVGIPVVFYIGAFVALLWFMRHTTPQQRAGRLSRDWIRRR
jgi:hypothetical protein